MFTSFVPGLKEIFEANKMAFENTYQTVCTFQNQAEEFSNMCLKQFDLAPQSVQKAQSDFMKLVNTERDNWKKTIDMGFQSMEKMFAYQASEPRETKSESQKTSETAATKKSEEKSGLKAEESSSKKTAQEKAKSSS